MPDRIALLVATLAYIALAGLVPAVRLRRSTGSWGIAIFDRQASLRQRAIDLGIGICACGLLVWVGLDTLGSASSLGVWAAPGWVAAAGWACVLCGLIAIVVAQAQMVASWRIGIEHAPTQLITRGLFAFVRNPIFAAGGIGLIGMVLVAPSPGLAIIAAATGVLVRIQVRLEEQNLLRVHGDRYLDYASKVGRFLPGIGRLDRHLS